MRKIENNRINEVIEEVLDNYINSQNQETEFDRQLNICIN